jgi:glutaredoxin
MYQIRQLHCLSPIFQQINLTFFTKETCKLCSDAKGILHKTLSNDALKDQNIKLTTIDIMDPKNQKWFDVYCYDVPVLHVNRESQSKPVKFMHYFYEDKLMNEFQK